MQGFIGYLIGINLLALILMAHDKSQARKRGRRVSERTLFLTAAVGGAIGAIVGMRIWRHKTKHVSFVVGMPAVLIVQAIIGIWLFGR